MTHKDEWIRYQEIDFNDVKFNVFSIDTRDFHAGYRFEQQQHKDIDVLVKYPHFFNTEDEVWTFLNRIFKESGGMGNWRCLDLDIENDSNFWRFKYIRIWRTKKGFLICDCENRAIRKKDLKAKMDKEVLGYIY